MGPGLWLHISKVQSCNYPITLANARRKSCELYKLIMPTSMTKFKMVGLEWQDDGCCCDSETGGYIVAGFDILLSIAGVIYGSITMATVSEIENHRSVKKI